MKPFIDNSYYFVLVPDREFRETQDIAGNKILEPAIGSISFTSYTDKTDQLKTGAGRGVMYTVGIDKFNRPRGKNFTLSQSHRAFRVRPDERDINGISMYDFIRNHPECEGSPNGAYKSDGTQINVTFRLADGAADSKIALDATLRKADAQSSAGRLDDQTLMEVAAVGIAAHGEPDSVMRHKVVEWAGRRPEDYFKVLEAGDRLVRAIIRRGLATSILDRRGELIYWADLQIGTSEEKAIQFLLENEDIYGRLAEKVDLTAPEKSKSKVGRPKKDK
jgi:hypothetical protein